jgi:adenylate cyclase
LAGQNSIFDNEDKIISGIKAALEHSPALAADPSHLSLISAYERLLRTTKHLVKLNDSSAQRQTELAREAAEKNRQLVSLSTQLAKYLSPQVYETIFSGSQEVSLQSSRKKLTVFFSDLVGFTSITDNVESEDLTAALNYYLNEMSAIALQFGATIDKYIGDAIMIFFGDPETRGPKEDASRCVSMAIAMQERLYELSDKWQEYGFQEPFRTRIGIHTSYCTVGNFGSDNRLDYTAIGAGANMASRLESAAEPDSIYISFETYSLVKDTIHCTEVPTLHLKGIANPVRAFKVLDASAEDSVIRIKADRSHLIARLDSLDKKEIDQLRESFSEALELIDGHIKNSRTLE